MELDRLVAGAIDGVLDRVDGCSGPQVARDVAAALPAGSQLVVASSMPVRDLEWFAGALTNVAVHANRGVNGIDGTMATATGVAIGSGEPTVAVLGDLAFLHDAGSLLGLARRTTAEAGLTIVVADNRGGGIFSFLAQHDTSPVDEFERLFGTPHDVDLVALARAYGVDAQKVASPAELRNALAESVALRGVRVVVVPVLDRDADVVHHRDLWAAAQQAVISAAGDAAARRSAAAQT